MLNTKRLNVIYSNVYCLRKYRSVEDIENILFLLQYDHLKEKKYPLYCVKTHIGKNGVRVEYISDLLRVGKQKSIHYEGYGWRLYRTIENLYKKYKRVSNEDIEVLVHTIISTQKLNEKYFVCNEYNDKYRKRARLTIRTQEYLFLPFVKRILGAMSIISVIILLVTVYFVYFNKTVELTTEKYCSVMEISMIGFVSFISWIYMTKKWMCPTKYEVEHSSN